MQWTPDRNAGFSTADPGKLYLPVVQSLVYNYSLVNVESQLAQSRSLLHWIRNVIHVRKAHPTFGLGGIRVLRMDHESVLAFVRDYAGSGTQFGDVSEQILCVFSFAHNPVSVRIELTGYEGQPTVDLFGGGHFPDVGDDGILTLTLASQSFYWLHLGEPHTPIPRAF
jgi:maltose alpha-D-glucosyltransferase/alpha-amylase